MTKHFYMIGALGFALTFGGLSVSIAQDDVLDQKQVELRSTLEQTIEFLDAGNLPKVKSNIDYLNQLMGQMRAVQFSAILPQALDGWTQGPPSSQNISQMAFGGGLTASGVYTADDDGREVTVDYITDSPMMSAFSMMANPMMMAQSNIPTFRVNTYTFMEENGELKGLVGNVLVMVKGATQEDRLAYANALPFEDLESFK